MTMTRNLTRFFTAAVLTACLGMLPAAAADNPAPDAKAKPAAKDGKAPAAKAAAKPAKAAKKEPLYPLPDDPRPYAASPYAKEIDTALNFLVKDKSFGRWNNLAFLDLLQRKFGLHKRYSIAETFPVDRQTDADKGLMELLGRLTDPNHKLDTEKISPLVKKNLVVSAMIKALYCDQTPLPADYLATLAAMLDTNQKQQPRTIEAESAITTFAFDYQWLKENGCAAEAPGFAELKDKISAALVDLIKKGGVRRDAAYESVALLYYLDCAAAVEKAWVDEIAAAQQIDGGWTYAWEPKMGVSDGHPTVFALWALLEAALPDVPETAMIPKAPESAAEKPAAKTATDKTSATAAEKAPEKK